MSKQDQHIILFDGVCNFCDGAVQFVLKHDKKAHFKFASLQSAIGQELSAQLQLPTDNFDTFVYIQGEQHFLRSTAALRVLQQLGTPWSWAVIFLVVPAFLRDGIYRFIAQNRYRFWGKKESCMLPTPSIRARFL